MTLQQLKYILVVAEEGSITEAAKKLFLSQPSLSNAVKEVEKEVGISIFSRSRTGATLTKEGMEFLGYARQVIQQMELLDKCYVSLLFFELFIATIGMIATSAWIGMGMLLQKCYLKHYRIVNGVLALTLLECVYSMLK